MEKGAEETIKLFDETSDSLIVVPDSFWSLDDLYRAVRGEYILILEVLIRALRERLTRNILTESIKTAIKNGSLPVVQLLVDSFHFSKFLHPSYYDNLPSPVEVAASNNMSEILLFLIKRQEPTAEVFGKALRRASYRNSLDCVKILLAREDADPSFDNNAALGCAIDRGNVEILKELLAHPKTDVSIDIIKKGVAAEEPGIVGLCLQAGAARFGKE